MPARVHIPQRIVAHIALYRIRLCGLPGSGTMVSGWMKRARVGGRGCERRCGWEGAGEWSDGVLGIGYWILGIVAGTGCGRKESG